MSPWLRAWPLLVLLGGCFSSTVLPVDVVSDGGQPTDDAGRHSPHDSGVADASIVDGSVPWADSGPLNLDGSADGAGGGFDAGSSTDASIPGDGGSVLALARRLSFDVVDAEYSRKLDRIIAVSSTPPAVQLVDGRSGSSASIALPIVPTAVSVSPDGMTAAVGHDAYVSIVDLVNNVVLHTWPVTCPVLDVVLAGNGYAHAFPARDQWVAIHSIDIATGTETLTGSYLVYAGTLARLHPDGKKLYAAVNGLSPDNLSRYDVTSGVAMHAYDSPYWGDYPFCGNLWFSTAGARIFTRCGNLFRSSDVQAQDMTYGGKLANLSWVSWADSAPDDSVVAVLSRPPQFWEPNPPPVPPSDHDLYLYRGEFVSFDRTIAIPDIDLGTLQSPPHALFDFFSADGKLVFVLVQGDASVNATGVYGVAAIPVP